MNLYRFGRNNPVVFQDPNGTDAQEAQRKRAEVQQRQRGARGAREGGGDGGISEEAVSQVASRLGSDPIGFAREYGLSPDQVEGLRQYVEGETLERSQENARAIRAEVEAGNPAAPQPGDPLVRGATVEPGTAAIPEQGLPEGWSETPNADGSVVTREVRESDFPGLIPAAELALMFGPGGLSRILNAGVSRGAPSLWRTVTAAADDVASIEARAAIRSGAEPVGGATRLKVQAAELVPKNAGRARVTLDSPSVRLEMDLVGKAHAGVETPHMKLSPRNLRAPEHRQPAYNTNKTPTVDATQQEIRTVRRYLERQRK